jgi:hypothetical protein
LRLTIFALFFIIADFLTELINLHGTIQQYHHIGKPDNLQERIPVIKRLLNLSRNEVEEAVFLC